MTKGCRLWRRDALTGRYYQIRGDREVELPYEGCPLKLPKRKFSLKQRQVIIDWVFGRPSDYARRINSYHAVARQLQLGPSTVEQVVQNFIANGCRNIKKTARLKFRGRKRQLVGSAELENELVSTAVLKEMAPYR